MILVLVLCSFDICPSICKFYVVRFHAFRKSLKATQCELHLNFSFGEIVLAVFDSSIRSIFVTNFCKAQPDDCWKIFGRIWNA